VNPQVSVAMIVRNEARHLIGCLESLRPLAGEICVADTGSEDGTADLARQWGCVVGHFPWRGDFSAARNASLELCRGAWIFVVDADERIDPADAPKIRALMEHGPRFWYSFITRNYTRDTHISDFAPCLPGDSNARGYAGWYPSLKVRLFPNDPESRFVGRVHELLRHQRPETDLTVSPSGIPIHHYPLDKPPEAIEAKRRLYLELGRQKLEESPDCAPAWAELAAQHGELGEYAQAAAAYRQALRIEPANGWWLRELGGMLLMLGNTREAETALTLAARLEPGDATILRNLGVLHSRRGEWEQALAHIERAMALAPDHSGLHLDAAVALDALGRHEQAICAAREALRLDPHSEEARRFIE